MNKRTAAELHAPSVYCQQRSNRKAREAGDGRDGGGGLWHSGVHDQWRSNSGGIRTDGHPEPSPRRSDGSSLACSGSLLLGAMSTHVSTVQRVAATCTSNGDECPPTPPLSHHARCVHAAFLNSPAVRGDRKGRPAARYSSSLDVSGGWMVKRITPSLVERAWALGFLSTLWRRCIHSRVYAGCAARTVTWVDFQRLNRPSTLDGANRRTVQDQALTIGRNLGTWRKGSFARRGWCAARED